MIRVYIARQRYDAYLVADRLNQAGIRAHVFNEHASSIAGEVPPDVAQPHVGPPVTLAGQRQHRVGANVDAAVDAAGEVHTEERVSRVWHRVDQRPYQLPP